MNGKHSMSIAARPASGPGALDGFEVSCSCGDRASFAFESMAVAYVASHVAYWGRRDADVRATLDSLWVDA